VIEDKEIRKVAEKNMLRIDKRSVFATNKEIFCFVMKATSRVDSFYKSNVLTVPIPPFLVRIEVKYNY
jgi:transcriptional regulator with PAS, ATPase and Fis domain